MSSQDDNHNPHEGLDDGLKYKFDFDLADFLLTAIHKFGGAAKWCTLNNKHELAAHLEAAALHSQKALNIHQGREP